MKISVLAILLILPFGALAQSLEVDSPEHKILKSDNGRYIFGQISDFRRDQYLLDTETGRLWQIVTDSAKQISLQPVPFINIFDMMWPEEKSPSYLYAPEPDSLLEFLYDFYMKQVSDHAERTLKEKADSKKSSP